MDDLLEFFSERIREAIGENVLDFARRAGLTPSQARNLQNWKDKPSSIKPEALALIASASGRPIGWFFGETAPATVMIPVLDVQASAGPGRVADVVKAEDQIAFPLYFLRRLLGDRANSARLESLRAHGDSMAPTITSGALILIDRGQRELPDPPKYGSKTGRGHFHSPIFVFYQGGDLRLKRLQRINRDFVAVISDNNIEFPVEATSLKDEAPLRIIGKVIWWDNML